MLNEAGGECEQGCGIWIFDNISEILLLLVDLNYLFHKHAQWISTLLAKVYYTARPYYCNMKNISRWILQFFMVSMEISYYFGWSFNVLWGCNVSDNFLMAHWLH